MPFFRSRRHLIIEGGAGAVESDRVFNKNSGLWDCIGRKHDKYGGYLYKFRLKEEVNYFKHPEDKVKRTTLILRTDEAVPAIEDNLSLVRLLQHPFTQKKWIQKLMNDALDNSWDSFVRSDRSTKTMLRSAANKFLPLYLQIRILLLDNKMDDFEYFLKIRQICLSAIKKGKVNAQSLNGNKHIIKSYTYEKQLHEVYYQLGYRVHMEGNGDFTLTLPNKNAFKARWEKLQRENIKLNLPPIDIISSKGVASDSDFILSFLQHDVLLSSGREFIHDHMYHLSRLVELIFSNDNNDLNYVQRYLKEKGHARGQIRQVHAVITRARAKIENGELSLLVYEDEEAKRTGVGRDVTLDDLLPLEYALGLLTDGTAAIYQYDAIHVPSLTGIYDINLFDDVIKIIKNKSFQNTWNQKWADNEEFQRLANPYSLVELWKEITSHVALEKTLIISMNNEGDTTPTLSMP